jgi:histone H3/H4
MTETVQPTMLGIPEDALERIIKNVCDADPRLTAAAAQIDRAQFEQDMMQCAGVFQRLTQYGTPATAKARHQQFVQIRQASVRLHDLLNYALSDDSLQWELSRGLSEELLPSSGGLLGELHPPIITFVERMSQGHTRLTELVANLEAIARIKPIYPVFGTSVFEGFAGVHLPRVFQKYFGMAATRKRVSYGNGRIEGGAIAFAAAVMRELHITKPDGSAYAHETISRAMTLARQKKRRRRSK